MGLLNWIVGIIAICTASLLAKEKATEVSIAVLVGLCVFHRRNTLLGWIPGLGESSNSRKILMSSRLKLDAHQVNDSLYELYKPEGDPTMQVVFFHGLLLGECSEAHLSTWISGDGSCIWPKVWLAERFPHAHILVVSYIEGLRNGSAETFDMRIIRENLTRDLIIQANIGQTANCPVILVGHSFGGLVIKDLCLEAQNTLISPTDKAKVQKFLDNLSGVFYYSTPHHGSADIGRARSVLSRPLFKYFTVLSTEAGRLNYDFNRLHNSYPKWQIGGLGEQLPVETGLFKGIVVVPEASARDGETFNVDNADHFSICRPDNTISRRFHALTTLLDNIWNNLKDEKAMSQKQAVRQNLQHLPEQMINVDGLVEEVKIQLKKYRRLGFVGMGGLGKTTLAKAVFNELSSKFEYSCFVPDVKMIKWTVEEAKQVVWEHMHHFGQKVGEKDHFSDLIGKGILLVFDDISDDRDITLLRNLAQSFSQQSRFIATSRDRLLLSRLDGIYEVPFLEQKNAEKLFLSHAFPQQAVVPRDVEQYMVSIVEKCGGLPLTLEVIGSYLKLNKDGKFWKQTLRALEKAEAIQDLDTRLWEKLRVSYDGLGEVEKQMFLDATTFFSMIGSSDWSEPLSLREAKAAWREAYGTECESLLWRTLVDRSLVYHVEENERIRVHDQLLSLGQKIASDCSKNGKCRVWGKKTGKLLKDDFEGNQEIYTLRLDEMDEGADFPGYILSHALCKLKKLRYLALEGALILEGPFPSNLVLLKCNLAFQPFYLGLQDRLVVLNISLVGVLPSSIGQLSALRIFIGEGIHSVPDEFCNLSRLEHLEFRECSHFRSLPEAFGKLSQLQYLKFASCARLEFLPETFGGLSNLTELVFEGGFIYPDLHSRPQSSGLHSRPQSSGLNSLPQSFGDLSSLNHLVLRNCPNLVALPSSFGNLSALHHLEFSDCHGLSALPSSFGNLSALDHLEFSNCHGLSALPDSFGNLSALKYLKFEGWFERESGLCSLPQSFGDLSSLNYLVFRGCSNLVALPSSFGNLSALEHLEFSTCSELSALPDSFGNLSALKHLEITYCDQLHALPDSFGNLLALEELKLTGCGLEALPNSFGNLLALEELKLSGCGLEAFPNSFGKLSALRHLGLEDCENLLSAMPFSQQLTQLQYLEISGSSMWGLIQMEKLPDSLAELPALSHLVLKFICIRSIPEFMKSMESLHTLELNILPYIKELPPWLGETGSFPVGLSCKMFQRKDGRFQLTSEESSMTNNEMIETIHGNAMKKARESHYEGAVADLSPGNLGVLEPKLESFLLQERAIARRFTGDLKGALEDLTVALEICSAVDDGHECLYDCFRHRGYVNFLLGDLSGAEDDGADALKHLCVADTQLWHMAEGLSGESVAYMDFGLIGSTEVFHQEKLMQPVHSQVMWKVESSDFSGALAIWCAFDASMSGSYHQAFFLQERGVLRRMVDDLPGALEDLTAALEIWNDGYDCLKHRGYVKYLMGDEAGSRRDAGRCEAMDPEEIDHKHLGKLPVAFLEFRFKGGDAIEDLLEESSHREVMEKVKGKDFRGALAIWDCFQTMVLGSYNGASFLQERGILRRMAGDLPGAVEDLTAALEIWDSDYDCLKHRGYAKFLMGDEAGARRDAERCEVMEPDGFYEGYLGKLPVAYLEFRFKGGQVIVDLLEQSPHNEVMEKVKGKDFVGALAVWDDFQMRVFGSYNGAYFLQERGILRRMTGDLPGALEDLTAALGMWDDDYDCLKHRGYVKFLMGDKAGARRDGERCTAMIPNVGGSECLGGLPVTFLEFRLKGRVANERKLKSWSHKAVMEKVKEKDFLGALAIWDEFDAQVIGSHCQYFFLQERGILKRMAGNLHGALEDLTGALELGWLFNPYECLKHRGYVKFLLGDIDGAQKDGENCLGIKEADYNFLGGFPVTFLEFKL